jgi:hypothetical protein
MKQIRSIILLLTFALSGSIQAQTEYGETFKSRLYVGGNFGLQFGSLTSIDLSPFVGYNINRHFSAGLGMTYMFYSYRFANVNYRSSFYGGRIFTRIRPLPDQLPGLFLHGEYESINNERYVQKDPNSPYVLARAWTPAVLAGLGFRQQAGTNSFFTISILYNVLDDGTAQSSVYGGPLIYRVGFVFGLY